jgi:hypothetical protein
MEEKMRVMSQSELLRLTRTELMVLLRKIACELSGLPEGSIELRNAHANLLNIRRAPVRGMRRRCRPSGSAGCTACGCNGVEECRAFAALDRRGASGQKKKDARESTDRNEGGKSDAAIWAGETCANRANA